MIPDYTDDEQEAFIKPIPMSYPSGSMTLPKPAVKKQQQQTSQHHHDMTKVKFSDDKVTSSHDTKVTFNDSKVTFCDPKVTFNESKVTFKGLPTEEKVVTFRNNNINNLLLPNSAITTTTTEVVKKITPLTDNNNHNSQQVKFGDNVKVVTGSYDSKVTFKGLSPVTTGWEKLQLSPFYFSIIHPAYCSHESFLPLNCGKCLDCIHCTWNIIILALFNLAFLKKNNKILGSFLFGVFSK